MKRCGDGPSAYSNLGVGRAGTPSQGRTFWFEAGAKHARIGAGRRVQSELAAEYEVTPNADHRTPNVELGSMEAGNPETKLHSRRGESMMSGDVRQ